MTLLLVALASGSAACPAVPPIHFHENVSVEQPVLRFGDVAELEALPTALRKRAASLPLLRLPGRQRQFDLASGWIAARGRGQMPALACWLAASTGGVSRVRVTLRSPAPSIRRRDPPVASGAHRTERLTLVSNSGVVRVSRVVEALQDARPHQRLFVRTEDGSVVSARYGEARR
ncbi:hypothetical protein [Flavisphingomonas formosensis]|uniref:hypothetical protein n=1 Tax=Flavisphingomonas formosensis TaxID=861534 RepID=UPI0012FB3E2E|nr:hypothetical protein [Sphingomonas formosensis]